MAEPPARQLGALTFMATNPRLLARFYVKLLRWTYIREEEPAAGEPPTAGYAIICPPEDTVEPALNFDYDPARRRPAWPGVPGEQTSTMHLDIAVADLETAVAHAVACGASKAQTQPNPTDHVVMIDPEGNPFCLCRS